MPTMWRGRGVDSLLSHYKLLDLSTVGELIIIDNACSIARAPRHPKVRHYPQMENIFVNPAWNLGVSLAKFDMICLLSDDVIFDPSILEQIDPTDYGVIGLDNSCDRGTDGHIATKKAQLVPTVGSFTKYERTFGALMFLLKKNYYPIPQGFKIFFGDVWLYHQNWAARRTNACITNIDVVMTRGTTSMSSEMANIVASDQANRDEVYWKPRP